MSFLLLSFESAQFCKPLLVKSHLQVVHTDDLEKMKMLYVI